jgi:radical SAM protein with 4Fe4S-binding SPASM domain
MDGNYNRDEMNNDKYGIDSHKLMFHPRRAAQWVEAGQEWEKAKKIYPIYIEISPAGTCNHRCVFCAMDYIGYKPRFLSMDVMDRVLPEMGRLGVKSVLFAGEGEPFLYRDIGRLSKRAKTSGIDVAFTSNGVFFDEPIMRAILPLTSWIKISINAGNSKTYATIHKAKPKDFDKVVKNLAEAVAIRNSERFSCTIGAQILLLPENCDELESLAKICRDTIGLDYLVIKPYSQHRFSQTKRYNNINYTSYARLAQKAIRYSTEKFSVIYRDRAIENQINSYKRFSSCGAVPFFWAHVMANQDVYACSAFLMDRRFYLGNLQENTFQEIWEGERRKKLFLLMMKGFDLEECRLNCRMGYVNEYLWQFRHPNPHVNFI